MDRYYVSFPIIEYGRVAARNNLMSRGLTRFFDEFALAKKAAIKVDGRVHDRQDNGRVVYEHQPADLVPHEDRAVKSQAERRASWARFLESQLFVSA